MSISKVLDGELTVSYNLKIRKSFFKRFSIFTFSGLFRGIGSLRGVLVDLLEPGSFQDADVGIREKV